MTLNAQSNRRGTMARALLTGVPALLAASTSIAQVATTPTTDPQSLAEALVAANPGLTITSLVIRNGVEGQFGVYSNFAQPPVTIGRGVVLSSGNVAQMGPFPEAQQPDYDPSSPPGVINSAMNPDPAGGGTQEFDHYGNSSGNIENFNGSYDVAAIEVTFELADTSAVKFDFIFGSVEFPYWTSQFTDAFLVFLDGTNANDQVTFDANGNAVQVGSSFAGLETTADLNTAFSNPHALIHHLTTTTPELDAGPHTLIFEVGDVNDQILDSAVFITNLRAGIGNPGTDPSDDDPLECPGDINRDSDVTTADLVRLLGHFGHGVTPYFNGDLTGDGFVSTPDLTILLAHFGNHC